MDIRRSRFWPAPALVLVWALVPAVSASAAQCPTFTSLGSGVAMGMNYIHVSKTFPASHSCYLTMYMNVFACFPGGQTPTGPMTGTPAVNVIFLQASAFTTATNPSCGWMCSGCGAVLIDGGNGLPVELMEFSVEEADSAGGADESGNGTETAEG